MPRGVDPAPRPRLMKHLLQFIYARKVIIPEDTADALGLLRCPSPVPLVAQMGPFAGVLTTFSLTFANPDKLDCCSALCPTEGRCCVAE